MSADHLEKHRHAGLGYLEGEIDRPRIVLVGNPNVGKSLIFNAISGMNVDVSNFPGTTVEVTRTRYRNCDLYDTPGIYGVSSFNDEERVARDIILEADIVVNVVDATHLERDLFLTQQVIDMGKRTVVLLNFMDEVRHHSIEIDLGKLSHFLGVEILPVSAVEGISSELFDGAIGKAHEGIQRDDLHSSLHSMLTMVGSQAEALLILEGDPFVAERHGVKKGTKRDVLYIDRRNRVNYIVNQVLRDVSSKHHFAERLGRWAIRPFSGILIFAGTMYLAYLFIGRLVAQDLVAYTEHTLGNGMWEPWIRSLVAALFEPGSRAFVFLVGDYGVITMTTTYLIFLLLPLVVAFYLALALMEDSGYLPRLATMVDRVLSYLGLNGRAVIPLILGFGCVTSATITTRLLNTEREKTIATAILQFAIPCSAQLAVIAALLSGAGFGPMLLYTGVIFGVFVAVGTILNTILHGESSPLLLDLPPLRLPRTGNVLRKTAFRTYQFMKEASGWFFIGALAVTLAQMTGFLALLDSALAPVVVHWLQLPAEASTAFIMGIVRRDFGAAGLYQMSLTPMQVTVALIVITLFVPCIASLMVMMKERGWREGLLIWLATWIVAFVIGGAVSHLVI
ncbi:MAG TPA: ferrous iron transport protein B [Bacteroidota bacterium]|nr:ferrous iron transport protein B [Bacteroidota bacterium]